MPTPEERPENKEHAGVGFIGDPGTTRTDVRYAYANTKEENKSNIMAVVRI